MTPFSNKTKKSFNRRNLLIGIGAIGSLTGMGLYHSINKHDPEIMPQDISPQMIRIAYLKNEENQLLTIAQTKGFLKHYKINLDPIANIKNKTQIFDLLKTNQCDAAILSILDWLPQLLKSRSEGGKLMIGLNGGDFRLLVTHKQKIQRLMDLANLSIGIQPHSEKEKLFFSILLRRKGINPDLNVKWVELEKDELLPALLSGQIQALIGSDPFIWRILHHNNKKLFQLAGSQTGSWSQRINYVLGISNHFQQSNPLALKYLATAIRNASVWQSQHIQEASQILTDEWQKMRPEEILKMFLNENRNMAIINDNLWEQVAQYIDEFKLLGQVPNSLKSGRIAKQFCVTL